MSHDPIDQLGARLFQAAREEQAPDGASRRALELARGATSSRRVGASDARRGARPKLLLWAAALALVAGAAFFVRREPPSSSITQEPLAAPSRPHDRQALASPPASIVSSAAAVPSPSPRAAPSPARSAPLSLSDELEVLKVAQDALGAGNTQAALEALNRYDHALKGKKVMRAESTLLRIETLSRAGQGKAATELAQRFIAENPTSPLVDRARSFVVSKQER